MVDQVTFRTDDDTRWGPGQGSDLSATVIDINFWVLLTAVQALQTQSNDHAGIDHFVITGTTLFVHLTNHMVLGPYTLPMANWNFTGEWHQLHVYNAFDVFTHDKAVYLVLMQHTSRSEFAADAADDTAHKFYGLLLAAPDPELPQTAEAGQLLQWQNSPGDVRWITPTRNIAIYVENTPDPLEKIMEYCFTEETTFPVALTASQFSVGTRPTGNQEFDFWYDGAPIGSVIIHPSGAPTISFPHAIVFEPGDVLTVIGPTVPDAHMTRIRFTFVGLLP
jgi:hypothetical protein